MQSKSLLVARDSHPRDMRVGPPPSTLLHRRRVTASAISNAFVIVIQTPPCLENVHLQDLVDMCGNTTGCQQTTPELLQDFAFWEGENAICHGQSFVCNGERNLGLNL
eukprot:6338862-Amphidinium_carterae.2